MNRGKEVEDYRQNHQVRYLHASASLSVFSIPCMAGSLYKYTSGSQIDLTVITFIHLISFHFYAIIIYL